MKNMIETADAPSAIGTYSQAIKVGNTIYLSGQIPLDVKTMTLVEGDIAAQTHQVFRNLQAVAKAAGGTLNDIVKLTIYMMDLGHFAVVNDVMSEYFDKPYPARATVQVSALPKLAQIEMDAIMELV